MVDDEDQADDDTPIPDVIAERSRALEAGFRHLFGSDTDDEEDQEA